ncbi:MAG TPA: hypothetical protein ENK70_02845 [Methylophaga sp.]|nr:hypothetical protein [Methylophaga sp.]
MATSILAAIDNASCTNAPAFSGQSTSSTADVYLAHDTAGTVGNGTTVMSGSGLTENDLANGTAYASLVSNEARLTLSSGATYNWDETNEIWNQISAGGSPDATTTSKGIVELATNGESSANVAVQGSDSRLHTQNTDTSSTTNILTLDSDNTGGNVTLQFGAALAETLLWDSSNTRFTFSDDLRVEGNVAVVGIGYFADDHSATDSDGTLSLGRNGSSWETLIWKDSNSQFEFSDDISITGGLTVTGSFMSNSGDLIIGTTGLSETNAAGDNGATLIGVDQTEFTNSASTNVQDVLDDLDSLVHEQNTSTGSIASIFTLDSDNAGAGANIDIVANQGSDSDGTLRYNAAINQWEISNDGGNYAEIGGWHGSFTRIRLSAADFATSNDDGGDNVDMASDGTFGRETGGADPVVSIAIPSGFRATHVMVYGSDTNNTVSTYENEIDDSTTATSLGNGVVGTEIDITDSDATAVNYITIYVNLGGGDRVYGGYITITPIP